MTAKNDIISQPETRLVSLSNHLTVKNHHTKRFLSLFFTKHKKHPLVHNKTQKMLLFQSPLPTGHEVLRSRKGLGTRRAAEQKGVKQVFHYFQNCRRNKHFSPHLSPFFQGTRSAAEQRGSFSVHFSKFEEILSCTKKHPKTDKFSHQEALYTVKKHHTKRFLSSLFTKPEKHSKTDKISQQEALHAVKKHHTKRFLSLFFITTLLTPTLHAAQLLDSQNTVHNIRLMHSDAEKARGLMYRLYLAPSQGMLFHFDPPQNARFWMYHTYIPLAISFYDAYGRLLTHYAHATPCYHPTPAHCPTYPAHGQVKYVLETRPAQRNIRPPYALPEPPAQLTHLQ